MLRRRRERDKVWGSTGGDRGPGPLVAIGGGLLILAGVVVLGFVMTALLRAGISDEAPFRTALALSCLMVLSLSGAIGGLVALSRRFGKGSTAQRTMLIGGLGILMGFAPLLMILVVYLLSRGGTP